MEFSGILRLHATRNALMLCAQRCTVSGSFTPPLKYTESAKGVRCHNLLCFEGYGR